MQEVESVLKDYGFRIIDDGITSHLDQIELFSKIRHLIAIHGAGITNILFRRGMPMNLLELHPRGYISGDFKQTCEEYGYAYDTLAGSPIGKNLQNADFSISITRLRQKIEKMILA